VKSVTERPKGPTRLWEVELDGFDGSTDCTDAKILWVEAPADWNAPQVAIALLPHHKGAKAIEPMELDWSLVNPADVDMVLSPPQGSDEAQSNRDARMTICSDCGEEAAVDDLANSLFQIHKLAERVAPGFEVPAGECACGGLAYLVPRHPDMQNRIQKLQMAVESDDAAAAIIEARLIVDDLTRAAEGVGMAPQ